MCVCDVRCEGPEKVGKEGCIHGRAAWKERRKAQGTKAFSHCAEERKEHGW